MRVGRRRGRRRGEHGLRLRSAANRRRPSPPGIDADDQRSRQRRAGDHRRLDPSRHAAHLRRLVFLVEGTDRRRPVKPDLVAPGEKILSCAAARRCDDSADATPDARLRTSTSRTAAPAWRRRTCRASIAAFLSIRREFIGRHEDVKQFFMSTATDLKRESLLSGQRTGRPDARHSVRLNEEPRAV